MHGRERIRLAVVARAQNGALHAGAEVVVVEAAKDRAVRQDSLRDGVLVWRGVDALEAPIAGSQKAVEVHRGLVRHPVRPDNLPARADAQPTVNAAAGKSIVVNELSRRTKAWVPTESSK